MCYKSELGSVSLTDLVYVGHFYEYGRDPDVSFGRGKTAPHVIRIHPIITFELYHTIQRCKSKIEKNTTATISHSKQSFDIRNPSIAPGTNFEATIEKSTTTHR